jgi:hypothetical protein
VEWIYLALNRDQRPSLVNTVTKPRGPNTCACFETCNFSRRTELYAGE